MKDNFVVKGSKSLLKAFEEELKVNGLKDDPSWNNGFRKDTESNWICTSYERKHYHYQVHDCTPLNLFTLPDQWDEAVEYLTSVEEVVYKEEDIVVMIDDSGDNQKGEIGKVTELTSQEEFRVHIPIRENYVNWCSPKSVRLATKEEVERYNEHKNLFSVGNYVEAINTNQDYIIKEMIYQVEVSKSSNFAVQTNVISGDYVKGSSLYCNQEHFQLSTKEAYDNQIKPKFKVGDWIKSIHTNNMYGKCTSIEGYKVWYNDVNTSTNDWMHSDCVVIINKAEVLELLTKEAKRRGLVEGALFNCPGNDTVNYTVKYPLKTHTYFPECYYTSTHNGYLYESKLNKWATPIVESKEVKITVVGSNKSVVAIIKEKGWIEIEGNKVSAADLRKVTQSKVVLNNTSWDFSGSSFDIGCMHDITKQNLMEVIYAAENFS